MLERMADRPDRIPGLLGEFRDNIGSLGAWIIDTESQPLQIDYFIVASPEQELPRATPTLWQGFVHELRAYIGSYTHDFTEIGDIPVDDLQMRRRTRSTSGSVWAEIKHNR